MDRKNLVMHLKRALILARNPETDELRVGVEIAQAYAESGKIRHDIDATMAMHGLAQRLAAKGLNVEAEIVVMAINIAAAASTENAEVYHHALIHLHELVCNHLDEITGGEAHGTETETTPEAEAEPDPKNPKNIREMN